MSLRQNEAFIFMSRARCVRAYYNRSSHHNAILSLARLAFNVFLSWALHDKVTTKTKASCVCKSQG